jgi:hypothetical protein
VDGDGLADALLGAPSHSEGDANAGAVALFLSGGDGAFDSADALVVGSADHQKTGHAVDFSRDVSASTNSGVVFSAWSLGSSSLSSISTWSSSSLSSGTENVGTVFLVESGFSTAD